MHRHGVEIVRAASTRDLTPALLAVWNHIAIQLPEDQRLDPAGLSATYRPHPQTPMIAVTMPPPTNMVEAHLAAIVLTGDRARYLVLEESWSPEQASVTVLAEWGVDGNHVNLGLGPAVEIEAFVHAVLATVQATD